MPAQNDDWDGFLGSVFYQQADVTASDGIQGIVRRLQKLESQRGLPGNRLAYLATDPQYFCRIIECLADAGAIDREAEQPWGRVVVEKPFGFDLQSAVQLDRNISRQPAPGSNLPHRPLLGEGYRTESLGFPFRQFHL